MKRIFYITLTFLLVLQFSSCYQDKGNYDYKEINEIKIEGLPSERWFAVRLSDSIHVIPAISGNLENYDITWTAVIQNGKIDDKHTFEIGKGKDLHYYVELPQQDYYIYCNVLDKTTNVSWRQRFELKVATATSSGWIVLSDENSMSRIDMISLIGDQELIVKDIIKDSQFSSKKGPVKLVMAVDYSNSGLKTNIILITETGTNYLDPEELTWNELLDYKYEMGSLPSNFIPVTIGCWSDYYFARNLLITTTEMYGRSSSVYNNIYGQPINYIPDEGKPFRVSPFIITDGRDCVYQYEPPVLVYDIDNKRFVQVQKDFRSCKIPTVKNEVFSMNTGKEIVYAANTRQNSRSSFVLLRGNDNKLWLYGFGGLETQSFTHLASYYYQIDANDIEKATMFAIHHYLPYLFYVVNNNIYQFDMVTKQTKMLTLDLKGETITFIKFNPLVKGSYGVNNNPTYKSIERVLIVGSYGANGGSLRMYNIEERMEQDATLHKEYTGFAKPVDVIYRER